MNAPISLPRASLADLDPIARLVAEVRWPHRTADVEVLIAIGHGRLVRSDDDGRVLAAGLWWPFGENAARVGLVIVSPDSQGQGIGRRLMETLLDDVAPRSVMLVATNAGRPLYEKLGFADVGAICQQQGEYRGEPVADPRIRLAEPGDVPTLMDLDAKAFGAERYRMLDLFMAAGRTVVLTDGGAPVGYAMEREFGRGSVVGPIVAPSEADAFALFRAVARPGFTRVDRPLEAISLGRWLTECGLPPASESRVMLRGTWVPAVGPGRIYALAGQALG